MLSIKQIFKTDFVYILAGLFSCILLSNACVSQVCRKRRNVVDNSVSLQLEGCAGSSPSWVRQVASCLSMNSADMVLEIKEWYTSQYDVCMNRGCRNVKEGATDQVAIGQCLTCWLSAIAQQKFISDAGIQMSDVTDCVKKYLHSFLSNELPTLETSSAHKGQVRIPKSVPSDNWWAITVKLPCKPRIFMFWNAYCINSFVDGLGMADFALTRNNFLTSEEITFYAEFDDTCKFSQDEIKILWSESIPTPALPQISSFPASFPPNPRESGKIYMNKEALSKLEIADGGVPAEFGVAGRKAAHKRRKRQAADNEGIGELGVMFPCAPKSFGVTGNGLPPTVGGGRRYLIDTTLLQTYNNEVDFNLIDFDIDFGFNDTGCAFDSSDVNLVVNPEPGWVDEELNESPAFETPKLSITTKNEKQTTTISQINRDVKAGKQRKKAQRKRPIFVTCQTCEDQPSNKACAKNGVIRTCQLGEVCITTVRQITRKRALVSKTCKQRFACDNIEAQNGQGQCRPGEPASVCRCCCDTDSCNLDYLPCI